MSDLMFPVFKDESGWTPPVSTERRAVAEAPSSESFRNMVTAQAPTQQTAAVQAPKQVQAPVQTPRAQAQTYVFKDEGGAFDISEPTTATQTADAQGGHVTLFAEGNEPTLWDVLDFINPLQHIPVVNTIYREITGDKIGAVPKLAGSFVVGGPVGVGIAMASLAIEDSTGKDIGQHVLAMFKDDTSVAGQTQYAEAAPQAVAQPQELAKPAAEPAAKTAAAEPAATATVEPVKTAAAEQPKIAAAAQPVTLASDAKFRPVPPRGSLAVPAAVKPPSGPQIPSNNAATQGKRAPAQPATTSATATMSATAAPAENSNEWFVNRFTDAMNKYDQARKLTPATGDGQAL